MPGKLTVMAKDAHRTLPLHAVALGAHNQLYLISVTGAGNTIQALAAALVKTTRVRFDGQDDEGKRIFNPERIDGKYRCAKARLGFNTWHMVAMVDSPLLIPRLSDEALWQRLASEQFTTPVVRQWVPWLRRRMVEEELLTTLAGFGCQCALLDLDTEQLDQLVSDGLATGKLEIPEE